MASKKAKKVKAVAKKPVAKAKVAKAAKSSKSAKVTKKPAAKKAKPVAKAKVVAAKVEKVKAKVGPVPPKKPNLVVPKNTSTKQFTQSEFFDSVQSYCGFNKRKEAKEFYDQFSGMIQNSLKSGYKLVLPGLGKMQVRKTKARKGINPATREVIQIPAKRKVAFTPLKALKTAVL
ncbi:MAG: HU family DNA-binding protein [Proteobacteria bacterium]|nr:HU family DNA-binding protein [Pseudomonadota bacterium]